MKTHLLQFQLNNYGSIHKATIHIQGMTVLTGPSGSGKSTFLEFVNQVLTCLLEYERYAKDKTKTKLLCLEDYLYEFLSSYENECIRRFTCSYSDNKKIYTTEYWIRLMEGLQKIYEEEYPPVDNIVSGTRMPSRKIYRIVKYRNEEYAKYIRKIVCPHVKFNQLELSDLICYIREYYEKTVITEEERIKNRLADCFQNIFSGFYRKKMEYTDFCIAQDDVILFSDKYETVGKTDMIRKVYNVELSSNKEILGYRRRYSYVRDHPWFKGKRTKTTNLYPEGAKEEICELLHTIIKGKLTRYKVFSKKNPEHILRSYLYYEREDGVFIPVDQCEPGIKTLLMFYRMLDEGLLTEDKLIIFDQPENFLGSERIVGFARLVCLIQKRLGVKFLFATNLREMLQALQNAAIEYDLGTAFSIYESKECKTPFSYNYQLTDV